MEHWKQNFDYKYTGAYELEKGEEKTVTIKKVCREEVNSTDGKKSMCLVAYFDESSKPMVLNKTNCKTIEKIYSPYTDEWIGKQITVFAKKVKAFGEEVEALRIRPTKPTKKAFNPVPYQRMIDDCKTIEQLGVLWTSTDFPQTQMFNAKEIKKNELQQQN